MRSRIQSRIANRSAARIWSLNSRTMPFDESDGENGSGSGSDDPDQSSAMPKSLSQRQDGNATDPDSVVEGTQRKKFDEQEGQSNDSSMHTPAQPSKRQRLLSVSPAKKVEFLFMSLTLMDSSAMIYLKLPLSASAASSVRGRLGLS